MSNFFNIIPSSNIKWDSVARLLNSNFEKIYSLIFSKDSSDNELVLKNKKLIFNDDGSVSWKPLNSDNDGLE